MPDSHTFQKRFWESQCRDCETPNPNPQVPRYKCSDCGEVLPAATQHHLARLKHCPNCQGTKPEEMDEDEISDVKEKLDRGEGIAVCENC